MFSKIKNYFYQKSLVKKVAPRLERLRHELFFDKKIKGFVDFKENVCKDLEKEFYNEGTTVFVKNLSIKDSSLESSTLKLSFVYDRKSDINLKYIGLYLPQKDQTILFYLFDTFSSFNFTIKKGKALGGIEEENQVLLNHNVSLKGEYKKKDLYPQYCEKSFMELEQGLDLAENYLSLITKEVKKEILYLQNILDANSGMKKTLKTSRLKLV